ncbi:hypothetical protein L3X38_004020 [Prunus dulcis]|uniref:Golgin candidate 5 n=1 Tax=Prunus dulcis TaxID=3755 RepID=A0AAD4ZN72_PRUDU|nr:hypothetical protein L3X38_004020 [Prunus dulcis]
MAWFSGKVSLGNFPDLAGAVKKLQQSVKNIKKNFDSALGFEEKEKAESGNEASGLWPSSTEWKLLFDPVISFMGQTNEGSSVDSSQKAESSEHPPKMADKEETEVVKEETDDKHAATVEETETVVAEPEKSESESEK